MDYLETHNEKMCAEILTGNTPNWPIISDIFEKSPHHMAIVYALNHLLAPY